MFLILEKCPYAGNFLWGPGIALPSATKAICSGGAGGLLYTATFFLHSVGLDY